jgi:hypothetical protein
MPKKKIPPPVLLSEQQQQMVDVTVLSEVRENWSNMFRNRKRSTNDAISELENWRAEIDATIAFLKAHQR